MIVDSVAHGFDFRFGTVTLPVGVHTFEWVGFEGLGASAFELAVSVGGGRTAPVTEANGWQVLGSPTPHPEISLAGPISVTAYYIEPGNLNTVIAGNYIGVDPTGTTVMPNTASGIALTMKAQGVRIGTDGNGSGDIAERNVITEICCEGSRFRE